MMGRMTTLARPYALAAFECAQDKNVLASWDHMLVTAAEVAQNPAVVRFLAQPEITAKQASKLFCEVLVTVLDKEKKNFIDLLAENKRLSLLPDIAQLFASYRAALDKTINVQVSSAVALDEPMKNKISAALTKRLKKQVSLECVIDPSLIGGVMVRAGDIVMDGSVQGRLKRLLDSLSV